MYSPRAVERRIAAVECGLSLKLVRYTPDRVAEFVEHLAALVKPDGDFRRPLTAAESAFIRNERLLSQCDFRYWCERYSSAILDQGGLGRLRLWRSQEILLETMGRLEDDMLDQSSRGEPVDGILIVLHKARQLGATAIGRAVIVHRLTTVKHTRSMSASLDDDKILELYDRDRLILDNLPWYLRPEIQFDEKAQHIQFARLGSRVIYQTGNQKFGVGQGRQFDCSHLTECASWPYPDGIEHDFFPTIPQSIHAFCLLESTAQGRRNWWHDLCKRVRSRQTRRWTFLFIPWYTEPDKYRARPPLDWKPTDLSMMAAKRVYETSPEFVGSAIMLSREQLYWWETTRAEYQAAESLNLFYTNYPSTPEESFQHTQRSAFSSAILEQLRLQTTDGVAYNIVNHAA